MTTCEQRRKFFFLGENVSEKIRGDPKWILGDSQQLSKLLKTAVHIKDRQIWNARETILYMDRCCGCIDLSDLRDVIKAAKDLKIDELSFADNVVKVKRGQDLIYLNYPKILLHSINRPYVLDLKCEIERWNK